MPTQTPLQTSYARTLAEAETKMQEESESAAQGRPQPNDVRGICPECGADLVANLYYLGGKGYLLIWECWNSIAYRAETDFREPTCRYRRVL